MRSLNGRLGTMGSAALLGWALVFGAGCSQEATDDTEASADRVSSSDNLKAPGDSFVVIEYGDKVVGTIGGEENLIEATASRPYGIGAISSYVLHKKDGGVFGVITAYGSTDGKPKVELVTNMKTGQTVFVAGQAYRSSIEENGVVKLDFLRAFKVDLEAVQRYLPKTDTGTSSLEPLGVMGTTCGGRILRSLFAGVLGAGIFAGGAYAGASSVVLGAITVGNVPAMVGVGLIGGAIGVVGGVAIAVVGVVSLGVAATVCLSSDCLNSD